MNLFEPTNKLMTTQSFIQNSLEHEKNLSNKIVLVFYAFFDKYAKTLLHDRDICYMLCIWECHCEEYE